MSPEHWKRLDSLYDAVSGLDPAERSRFIEEQCAGDEELRRQLLAILNDEGSGLTSVVEQAAAALTDSDDWTGRRMGPYRILRRLGQGGMGSVFLAVRDDDQFRKEVAIKTLKFETGDSLALTRFRHERQILAHLEHPNIARLLDGGTTEQGTPYIVLEHVAGAGITEYCEKRKLSIEDRLRLFREVCGAVQYAHQNLIVHRDIKPANILVAADGLPKLLDFGIAKLLDPGTVLGEAQAATATGFQLMTPDYASPEQVRGEAISTATDIYSMGAVLYQLLTGARPHALEKYDAVEIARVICQTETQLPSARGNRRLRGDLDNIILKAMQKDPARRYASVEQFSEDIRRHLEGLPISARPDTTIYRAAKFVRRHRIGVAAAAAVAVALGGGVAVSLHEAGIANRRFAQVRELANTFLFQFYDQVSLLPGSTEVRASMVETARKYLDGLSKEAGNDKGLILELAQAYARLGFVQNRPGSANLGQLAEARRSYQSALDLYARLPVTRESPADLRRRVAEVLYTMGRLEFNAYHEGAAEPLTRRALDLLADRSPEAPTRMLRARVERSLGQIRLKQGRTADAVPLLQSSMRAFLDLRSSGYREPALRAEMASARQQLARAQAQAGDLDAALSQFQDLVRDADPCDEHAPPGETCRTLAFRLSWVADIYAAQDRPNLGELAKAALLYQEAIHLQERLAAQDPQDRQARFDLASSCGKLGDAVWRSDPKRALALYERALTTAQALASKEQISMLKDSYEGAIIRPLIQLGRTGEARRALTEVLKPDPDSGPPEYPDLLGDAATRQLWVPLLMAEGKPAEARRALEELIRDTDKLRAGHPTDLTPVFYLSNCYRELASLTSGLERRQAFLTSAAVWHSWPATSYTRREEQKDLAAAGQ